MDISALSEMLKARVVKYIRRVPKPTGKGFYYFYNKADFARYQKTGDAGAQAGHGNFFDAIKSFFGVQSDKEISEAVKKEYAAHDIKSKFGLSVFEFTDHLAEYFTNRDKWNTFFTRKKAAEPEKKVKEKKKNTKKDVKKKVKSGGKSFAFSVMKFIFETYGAQGAQGGTNGKDQAEHKSGRVSTGGKKISGTDVDGIPVSDGKENESGNVGRKPNVAGGKSGERLGRNVPGIIEAKGQKAIKDIRRRCLELLATKSNEEMTDADKDILRQYEGGGGVNEAGRSADEVLSAFYTPRKIINKMWDLVNKYTEGRQGLDVLEPSAGSGRFAEGQNHNFDMREIDPTSSRIATILHADATVVMEPFEKMFMDASGRRAQKNYDGKKYDVVIGNPPYMGFKSPYKKWGEGTDHTRYEEYFIDRGLDTLKEGGIMSFIVPSSFMQKGTNSELKKKLAEKGRLLEAWRMPSGVFGTTGVGTDILVFRKEKGSSANDLYADNYFDKNPDHVLGDKTTVIGRHGAEEQILVKPGKTYDETIEMIDTNKVDIPKPGKLSMSEMQKQNISNALKGNKNAEGERGKKEPKESKTKEKKGKKPKKQSMDDILALPRKTDTQSVKEFNEQYNRSFAAHELSVWKHTQFDGEVMIGGLSPSEKTAFQKSGDLCMMDGKVYHKINYASGNIEDKLAILERDKANLSEEAYNRQKKMLTEVLPQKKSVQSITISPISAFAQDYNFTDENGNQIPLLNKFYMWATGNSGASGRRRQWFEGNVTEHDMPANIEWNDIIDFIEQVPVRAEKNDPNGKQIAMIKRTKRREVAERLMKRFIEEGLSLSEKEALEKNWNYKFNSYKDPNYSDIPISIDGASKTFKGRNLRLLPHQLRGISFLVNKGNGMLAYDIGLGKTLTGIFATVQKLQLGQCKKPLLILPKAVGTNWINEIIETFPGMKINYIENLNDKTMAKFKDADGNVVFEEGSLTIMTEPGLGSITFKDETLNGQLLSDVMDSQMVDTNGVQKSQREIAQDKKKVGEILGSAGAVDQKRKNTIYNLEDLGFDHLTIDEVHRYKNVFAGARPKRFNKGEGNEDKEKQQANEFGNLGGSQAKRAVKVFAMCQYIQANNNDRGVFALSATPFTNSPIEIYNMLSHVARGRLKQLGIFNMHEFLAQFAKMRDEWGVDHKGEIVTKTVMKEFQNLTALQNLIREYIDKITADDSEVIRPNPDRIVVELPMTSQQKFIMDAEVRRMERGDTETEKGTVLKAINANRMASVSPDLVKRDDMHKGYEPVGLVESSSKLQFVLGSTAKINVARPDLGQVIYMPVGTDHYDTFVNEMVKQGVKKDRIGMITGDTSPEDRDEIMARFNNPEDPLKVLIGSETIQEGINLNGNSAVIQMGLLDWNPATSVQTEGRILRQENMQENVFIVYPQVVDSVDSMMYQKHDEKGTRFRELWSYQGKDSLDAEDINPEDLKFALIKDPKKRAKYKVDIEKSGFEEKLRLERIGIDSLNLKVQQYHEHDKTIEEYRSKITTSENYLEGAEQNVTRIKALIEGLTPTKEEKENRWSEYNENVRNLEYAISRVKSEKDSIKSYNHQIKYAEDKKAGIIATLQQMGNITLETVPAAVEQRKKNIEELVAKKHAIEANTERYVAEAEEEIRNSQKQQTTVPEQIDFLVDRVLKNAKYRDKDNEKYIEMMKMQKAFANSGTILIVKRLNNQTGLFEYSKAVK